MTPNDLILREAIITDYDDILNITKDEKLYGGRDYLPHCLRKWLEQELTKSQTDAILFSCLTTKQLDSFHSIFKMVAKLWKPAQKE